MFALKIICINNFSIGLWQSYLSNAIMYIYSTDGRFWWLTDNFNKQNKCHDFSKVACIIVHQTKFWLINKYIIYNLLLIHTQTHITYYIHVSVEIYFFINIFKTDTTWIYKKKLYGVIFRNHNINYYEKPLCFQITIINEINNAFYTVNLRIISVYMW